MTSLTQMCLCVCLCDGFVMPSSHCVCLTDLFPSQSLWFMLLFSILSVNREPYSSTSAGLALGTTVIYLDLMDTVIWAVLTQLLDYCKIKKVLLLA